MAMQWSMQSINNTNKKNGKKNMKKIFEFTNSFIVINDIRSVIISPQTETSGVIFDESNEPKQKWNIRIIFKDEGIFKAFFDSENEARQIYNRLMRELKGDYELKNSGVGF